MRQVFVPALAVEQGEDRFAGVDEELQVGHTFDRFDQHLHRVHQIAAARGQHTAVVEFNDLAPDLRQHRLAGFLVAGLGEDTLDLRDHPAIFVVFGGDLAQDVLCALFLARGQAGVRQIDGDFLRHFLNFGIVVKGGVQGERLLQRLLGLGRFSFLIAAQTVHDQGGEFALLVATPVAAQLLGDHARTVGTTAIKHDARQIGVVVDDPERRSAMSFKHFAVGAFGDVEVVVAHGDVGDHALAQSIVGRNDGCLQ